MSTEYRAVIILGLPAEMVEIHKDEPRFDEKTGEPTTPVKVVDHLELRVGQNTIWSGKEKYDCNGYPAARISGVDIYETRDDRLIVGKKLAQTEKFYRPVQCPTAKDLGQMGSMMGSIQSILGAPPEVLLILDTY